jgi:hypothetical protein
VCHRLHSPVIVHDFTTASDHWQTTKQDPVTQQQGAPQALGSENLRLTQWKPDPCPPTRVLHGLPTPYAGTTSKV